MVLTLAVDAAWHFFGRDLLDPDVYGFEIFGQDLGRGRVFLLTLLRAAF